MKVLHVAVFTPLSTNVWQADGFENLGHKVIRYDYRAVAKRYGSIGRDEHLISLCRKETPDIILFSKCNKMDISVVEECGKVGKTVLWFMDNRWNIDDEARQKMKKCDYVFCSRWDGIDEASRLNDNVYRLQGGYDPKVHYPIGVPKIRDICFIGALRPDRAAYAKAVGAENITGVYNEDHSRVVSETKINLNFTEVDGTSNRLYKLMAAGGFVLTTPWRGIEEDFEIGKDLDMFNSPANLKERAEYYLEHEYERNKIAKWGSETVKRYDNINYAKRILEVVS